MVGAGRDYALVALALRRTHDLNDAPDALDVRRPDDAEEGARAGEEHGQRGKLVLDVLLVEARLVEPHQGRPPVLGLKGGRPRAQRGPFF